MSKSFLLIPTLLFALPSCDSAKADHHEEQKAALKTSTAIIQILPSTPVLADQALRTDNFIANEIASLSMGEVIEHAAEVNQWEQRQIDRDLVKKSLKTERIEGTDMAKIIVTSTDQFKGKDIINNILSSYLKIRMELESKASRRALDALDNELIAQSDHLEEHRKTLTVIIQQYGVPYFDNEPNPLGETAIGVLGEARKKHLSLKIESKLAEAKFRETEKNGTSTKELQMEIKILRAQREAMADLEADLHDEAIELSLKQNSYNQAKHTYEQSRALLHEMRLQQQKNRIALKIPRNFLIVRQKPN